jgi:hypothetical protein
MATQHTKTTKIEDGQEKECLRIDFTNGALDQLNELAPFLHVEDPAEVVKMAISYIQLLKENQTKDEQGSIIVTESSNDPVPIH